MEDLTPESSTSASGKPPRLTAKILANRAAAAALSGPAVTASQWIYRKSVVVATPANAASPVIVERWSTADNTVAGAYIDGQLEVGAWMWPVTPSGTTMTRRIIQPAISYDSLSLLPSKPRALVALLGKTPVTRARPWRPGHAVELIGELFQSYLMPPEAAARIYHALGTITGVTAHERATDVAGRPGTGFLFTGTGGTQEIIIDPRTHEFTGYQFLGDGRDIYADGAWGMAILHLAFVSGPGIRPNEVPNPGQHDT
jgi:hypothetical protein